MLCPGILQDPARARLHEETTRLTIKVKAAQDELENLNRSAKSQAKRLSKLKKDLTQLQDAKVSRLQSTGPVLVLGHSHAVW